MQFASQVPLHVPAQAALLTLVVPALATHEPVQFPEQVPWHWMEGAVPGVASHSPVHSAEHEPVHSAWTVAEPSHVAPTLHVPWHETESSPGSQLAVTDGGVQLALPLQLPSQLAWAFTSTVQPPPVMLSPHETLAETPASSVLPLRIAEIALAAALQAAVGSEPPSLAGTVPPRSVTMFEHAVKTEPSRSLASDWSEAVALTNAFASAEPLQLEFAMLESEFVELQPLARTGTTRSVAVSSTDLKALILAMTSSPCA